MSDMFLAYGFIIGFVLGAFWWNKQVKRDKMQQAKKDGRVFKGADGRYYEVDYSSPKPAGFDVGTGMKMVLMVIIIAIVLLSGAF